MKTNSKIVNVSFLGRHYDIRCPVDKADELKEAAAYLTQTLKNTQHTHGNKKDEASLALMAALNLSHELVILQKQLAQCSAALQVNLQALKD